MGLVDVWQYNWGPSEAFTSATSGSTEWVQQKLSTLHFNTWMMWGSKKWNLSQIHCYYSISSFTTWSILVSLTLPICAYMLSKIGPW